MNDDVRTPTGGYAVWAGNTQRGGPEFPSLNNPMVNENAFRMWRPEPERFRFRLPDLFQNEISKLNANEK